MKKAVLVVSFGTSYHETRIKTIEVCERKISENLKGYDFYRAFTSNMIRLYKTSDSITIKNFTMNSNSSQVTLKIENNINSLITNLNLYGDGGICGIWYIRNINTDITNCNIDYYNDRTTSNGGSGYGINLGGYNCTANGNVMRRCGGNTTNGYGVGLVYKNNTVYEADSSYPSMTALLSSRAMSDVSFLNNTLYVYDDIKVFSSKAWKQTIKDNLIITPDTFSSTAGTYLCHLYCDIYTPTDGIEFTGNEIIGSIYTKYSKTIQIELNDDKNNGTINLKVFLLSLSLLDKYLDVKIINNNLVISLG